MPIKFTCPHCKRGIAVKDELAGKRGACPGCKQIVTVPQPTASPAAAPQSAPKAAPLPKTPPTAQPKPVQPVASVAPKVETPAPAPVPPPPADVEAEAAALFSDEPPPAAPTEVKSIDLNCPFCDEPIHFTPDLAGKRAPCPECKHIIKVPELVKKDPKDWRKVEPRGPAGARLPDQPVPEGAWASTAASTVGKKTLEEAGVIPTTLPPRTPWQKVRWPLLGVTVLLVLSLGGWTGYGWWLHRTANRGVQEALAFAASEQGGKEAKATGQAAIALGAAEYYLRQQTEEDTKEARNQFGNSRALLMKAPSGNERDALLADLALAQVELGGEQPEVYKGLRRSWDETQQLLLATLREIQDLDARREAVRAVTQQLIARGQTRRVLPLVNQVYSTADAEKSAALSVVGLELWKANDKPSAEKAAEDALSLYQGKEQPPVRAEVIALAQVLQKKLPKIGEGPEDKANEHIGKVEGWARQGEWDKARQQASLKDFPDETRFRAWLALAAAAVDSKIPDTGDVDAVIQLAEATRGKPELSWSFLRLIRLAIAAGVPDERVLALADRLPDRALRGRAKLAIFRAQLSRSQQVVEESAADKIESGTLARPLASQALARHNTRLKASWAGTVQGWQQPLKAFGSLGIALGLQDRER